ncbi:MAG: 50S ribosomal protein L21 [Rhodobacteraceae bacterium]|nr:50S ribosomal protein L21 [Paracoccaceae bacterium]
MFAVLKTGGKQYRVQAGDVLRVELIAADSGDKVQFNEVLMIGGDKPVVGSPLVRGAAVQAEVIEGLIKADKVITYHKRRRKHSSQRTRGHRQKLTLVRITDILASGAETSGVKAAVGTHAARVAAHSTAKAAAPAAKSAAGEAAPAAAPAKPARAAKAAAAAPAATAEKPKRAPRKTESKE